MKASDKIKEFIKEEEGCRLVAYKPLPTDKWTIGFGSTYYSNGVAVAEGDKLLLQEAVDLLYSEIDKLCVIISKTRIPANVTGNQFDAVVSLIYNIGFSTFKNSATGKLFYAGLSVSEKFPMWIRSGGVVIDGLITRRKKEKEIYDLGKYPI